MIQHPYSRDKNKIKRLYKASGESYQRGINANAYLLGFRDFQNTEVNRIRVFELYKQTALVLSELTPDDIAFKKFYQDEERLRHLCLYLHLANESEPVKSLCLLVKTHQCTAPIEDVCKAYALSYAPWFAFVKQSKVATRGIVIDYRGKDLDEPSLIEAFDQIVDIKECCSEESHSETHQLTIEYAPCFFCPP